MNPTMSNLPPRFGARNLGGFDAVFGDQGRQLYERIMIGSGRIEITQAGAGVLKGFLKENPDKEIPLRARMKELGIPDARIDAVFAPDPPPALTSKKVQAALNVFRGDADIDRIITAGGMPTRAELQTARRRLLLPNHSDTGGMDDGEAIGKIESAWQVLSEAFPKAKKNA